jgi:hypothetical protein
MVSWLVALLERINRAFERRIERASGLDADHARADAHTEEEEGAEIVNLPRGAEVSE